MNKAYFTGIKNKITEILKSAKEEVLVAVAWFTQETLMQELIKCLERGVKVSVIILDDPNNRAYADLFNKLIDKGGTIYIADRTIGLMHHKFCVVDKSLVITGSYNWTHYAEDKNIENVVVSDDKELNDAYREEFFRLNEKLEKTDIVIQSSLEEIQSFHSYEYEGRTYDTQIIEKTISIPLTMKEGTYSTPITKTPYSGCNTNPLIKDVHVIDIKKKYLSKYNFGIEANGTTKIFIKSGEQLPAVASLPAYFDKNAKNFKCVINCYDENMNFKSLVIEKSILSLAEIAKNNSQLKIKISLEENGRLSVELFAVDAAKKIVGDKNDDDFVIVE